jgi:hypothetical protein
MFFSSRYRQIVKDRTQCNVYKEVGATYCSPIGDVTKETFPGNKQTKVARLVDLVRHTRGGKILYGYDPQMDPYGIPPAPIINGLRHGAVPVGMRKNKF